MEAISDVIYCRIAPKLKFDPEGQPIWTECAAVGDLGWIEKLASEYSIGQKEIISYQPRPYQFKAERSGVHEFREQTPSYGLKIAANNMRSFVKTISNKAV